MRLEYAPAQATFGHCYRYGRDIKTVACTGNVLAAVSGKCNVVLLSVEYYFITFAGA